MKKKRMSCQKSLERLCCTEHEWESNQDLSKTKVPFICEFLEKLRDGNSSRRSLEARGWGGAEAILLIALAFNFNIFRGFSNPQKVHCSLWLCLTAITIEPN